MALVNLTRETETLQGYQLTSSQDMVAALEYLSAGGYTGTVNITKPGSTVVRQMWLQHVSSNTSQSANVGDWIVIKNNAIATVVPQAQFASQYHTP